MPKPEEILTGLQKIVNDYSSIAIIWHIVFYALIAALLFKWLPTNRLLAFLICLPVLSVAILAFIAGNPFNGVLFTVLGLVTIFFGLKASDQPVLTSQMVFLIIGILMVAFGLLYPHFVNSGSVVKYLYASPAGLIPCPTLSVIIGLLLIYNGFDSRPLMLVFIIFGLFYGVFGVLKLAVYLDLFLILGTLALLVRYFVPFRM
jgi:hypothetical protein